MKLRGWIGGVAFGLLLGTMVVAVAEDISLTTYYPSPRGVYQDLRVTNSFRYESGTPGAGKIMTSDAVGNATWTDRGVPAGMVAIFPGGCPAGWSAYGAADGWYLMAGAAHGATGGRPDHFHTLATASLNHVHWSEPEEDNTSDDGNHDHSVDINHSHTVTPTGVGTNFWPGTGRCAAVSGCGGADRLEGGPHRHSITLQPTTIDGGNPTTSGASSLHHHVVDLPGWDVSLPVAWPPFVNTNIEDLDPPFFTVRLCSKD